MAVYVLPLRDPFSAAKAIATAANPCDGRLRLGVGVACDLPILIGGSSPATFERAARHQGFVGAQHEMSELGVTILCRDAFCDEQGMASRMSLDEKLRDMESFASQHLT